MAMRRRVLVIAALVGMLAASTGVAAQPLTPHFPGWERYFRVSWEPFERRGQPYLRGYIVSSYGATATRVQLLVDSLDSSGQIVAQRVEWLGGSTCQDSRVRTSRFPFVNKPRVYRVSVFAFD